MIGEEQEFELLKDPLGNVIIFPRHLSDAIRHHKGEEQQIDQPQDIIRKPAFVIAIDEKPQRLYYYRLLSESVGFLIKVRKEQGALVAFECIADPEKHHFMELAERGRILL